MRVVVTGGRKYQDRKHVYRLLDAYHEARPVTLLIHGAARGADRLADDWALTRGVRIKYYGADRETHGKAAGHIRNREMLVDGKPDCVIAFPGGTGTANMVSQARSAGVPVWTEIESAGLYAKGVSQ